jgi:hypothetical protein
MTVELLNAQDGVYTTLHYSAHSSEFHKVITQDVEPILKACKRERNQHGKSPVRDKMLNPKADIPVVMIERWNKELGDNCLKPKYRDFLRRKLNDPDNKSFLLCPGKMGAMSQWR